MTRHRYFLIVAVACYFGLDNISAQTSVKPSDTKLAYSGEAFVVEQDFTRVVFENNGTSERESGARVRIQSGAGVQRFGVLAFSYQNSTETVDIDYVRVKKPDDTVVLTPSENAQDMAAEITRQAPFYSDLREKHVAVKGLGVGDVLEYRVRWRTTKPLAPGQFWLAYNFSHEEISLQEQIQISVPRERPVKWKGRESKPAITEEGGRRVFTWTNSNLEHKSKEQERKDQEQNIYQAARGMFPPPEIQLSSFQSWEEVGEWYGTLQQERTKPTPEIRAKAAELTRGLADDNAKIQAIYYYVSTQFRYIGIAFGIGRYQPHSASDVLSNQYGDCKDKHTLLASLLDAVGIDAFPALINSAHGIDPEVPSPSQFDHVISVVSHDKRLDWADTTPEVAPYGYLVGPLRDKKALIIPNNKPATLETTPADPPSRATQTFRIRAKLEDTGTLEGKVERSVQGDDNELLLRVAFRSVPMPQWKDLIQRISYASGFAGEVSDATAGSPEKVDEPFRFAYSYTRKEYPEWANRRISPPIPPITLPSLGDENSKPSNPIWLGAPTEIRFESYVELPKGYTPELSGNIDLTEDFAEYHASSGFKDGVLATERRFVLKQREVRVNEYEAYKKFSKAVNDDHELYIALSSGTLGATSYQEAIWSLPYSDNPEAVRNYDNARDDFQRHDVQGEIASLNRAVQIDPKFIRAWLWLGEIYKFQLQTDRAVEAYRKAMAIDPRLPISYKALGLTLLGSKRFEDAVPIFQELIKVAPSDTSALTGLASALLALERYEEAASAFESAVKLNPQLHDLYMRIGSAYLKAGNTEKALTAYQKGLEADPQAAKYNEIGYELADAGKKMDLALEYAQKAVGMEEDASGKINLSDLRVEDLRHSSSLAAYWDTLGWAYFRLGNFDQAEKYLHSAWSLAQWGIVADHLGQVYEEQHKKQAAVRMYRLAAYRYSLEGTGRAEEIKKTGARIQQLSPANSRSDPNRLAQVSEDVYQLQNIKLEQTAKHTGRADFLVVLSPDPPSTAAKVEGVKFIGGAEELRTQEKGLKSANFRFTFPDDGHARLLRRGTVGCYQYSGCIFTLMQPDEVKSVN